MNRRRIPWFLAGMSAVLLLLLLTCTSPTDPEHSTRTGPVQSPFSVPPTASGMTSPIETPTPIATRTPIPSPTPRYTLAPGTGNCEFPGCRTIPPTKTIPTGAGIPIGKRTIRYETVSPTLHTLPKVLTQHGTPDQVYAFVSASITNRYQLILEYSSQGFMYDFRFTGIGDCTPSYGYPDDHPGTKWPSMFISRTPNTIACPIDDLILDIRLWTLPLGESMANLADLANDLDAREYGVIAGQPIAISPESFYEVFSKPGLHTCLRIPYTENNAIIQSSPFDPLLRVEPNQALNDLLHTSGGCEPPCWNGITPGITTAGELVQHFERDARVYSVAEGPGTIGPVYVVEPMVSFGETTIEYYVAERYNVQEGIVAGINIEPIMLQNAPLSLRLRQDWQSYTLKDLLKRYGTPSSVEARINHEACGDAYRLQVLYEHLDFEIYYDALGQHIDDKVVLCPMSDAQLALQLAFGEGYTHQWFRSGINAPEIDVDAFYALFTGPGMDPCLTLDAPEQYTCQ